MRSWLCVALVVAGCGGSEFDSSEDGSGGTSGSGGAEGCDGICTSPAPEGWLGPLLVYEGFDEPPLMCSGHYPTEEVLVLGELTAPRDCPCDCEPDSEATAVVSIFNSENCEAEPCATHTLEPNECGNVEAPNCSSMSVKRSIRIDTPGACAPSDTTEPSPVSWGVQSRVCLPDNTKGDVCPQSEELCLPEPSNGLVCIARPEEASCPEPYNLRLLRHKDVVDNRKCSGCLCGPTNQVGGVSLHATAQCKLSADTTTIDVPAQCENIAVLTSHMMLTVDYSAIQCAPSQSVEMSGEAEPIQPWTLCCRE